MHTFPIGIVVRRPAQKFVVFFFVRKKLDMDRIDEVQVPQMLPGRDELAVHDWKIVIRRGLQNHCWGRGILRVLGYFSPVAILSRRTTVGTVL